MDLKQWEGSRREGGSLTGCGFQDAHHDPDRRRFARAVGTKKAKDFARRHREIELIDSGEFAVVLTEIDELNHNNFGYFDFAQYRFWIADFRLKIEHPFRESKIQNPK